MDTDSLNSSRPVAGNSEMVAIGRHNVAKVQSWTLAFSSPKGARILFAIPRHLRSGRNRRDQKLDRWEKFGLIIPHSLELNARTLGCRVGLLILKTPFNSRKCLSFNVSSHHVYITEFSSLIHRREQSYYSFACPKKVHFCVLFIYFYWRVLNQV